MTKILGLDLCADTLVGDEMLKGISGGQKKRLTTGTFIIIDASSFIMLIIYCSFLCLLKSCVCQVNY